MSVERWNFDTVHSRVGFWVRHLMVTKVHGQFAKWRGSLAFDEADPERSVVEVEIDATSVDTRDPDRDAHLRTADFFDVENHRTITFKGTRIEGSGSDFELTGDLTIRGVTKPVTLTVEYAGRSKHPQLGERAGFSAHATIHRKDFGIVFNQVLDTGGLALSDKVEIQLEIQATRA